MKMLDINPHKSMVSGRTVETTSNNEEWYDNFRVSKTTFEYIVWRIEDEFVVKIPQCVRLSPQARD